METIQLVFDLYQMPFLTVAERKRLGAIQHAERGDSTKLISGMALCRLLLSVPLHREQGWYTPLSEDTFLPGKLTKFELLPTDAIDPAKGTKLLFFGNPLVLPEDSDDLENAPKPIERATNGGTLIITHEFDPETVEGFQESFGWVSNGRLSSLHKALCEYSDYRGVSVVYSGGRSLHFHFCFDTKHLKAVPFDAGWHVRLNRMAPHSATMENAYEFYWDRVRECIIEHLNPSTPTDKQMRVTQWKRFPWGRRVHEKKKSKVFEFPRGTVVPQIVLWERLLRRAPNCSREPMLSATFDLYTPVRSRPKEKADASAKPDGLAGSNDPALLSELDRMCRAEWGDYPKPTHIDSRRHAIYFKNNALDKNPSTVVEGDHRRLLICGKADFDREFYLPEGLTATKLLNRLRLRFGQATGLPLTKEEPDPTPLTPFERLRQRSIRNKGLSYLQVLARDHERSFPVTTITSEPIDLMSTYRKKIRNAASEIRACGTDYVLVSGEGAGKTSAHLNFLPTEALDTALAQSGESERFNCVATRSNEQAAEKVAEIRKNPELRRLTSAKQIISFKQMYRQVCSTRGVPPLTWSDFDSLKPHQLYQQIKNEQPDVYRDLESLREGLWKDVSFSAPSTILCTSNATLRTWNHSRTTRSWCHPDFCPDQEQNVETLRNVFRISSAVYDEVEYDEVLHVLSAGQYEEIGRMQEQHAGWRGRRYSERFQIYQAHRKALGGLSFEQTDELMRCDLDRFKKFSVAFDAAPFGRGRPGKNIYHQQNGRIYHVAPKDWLSSPGFRLAFLTTEKMPSKVLEKIYKENNKPLAMLNLGNMPGIYPVSAPLIIDAKAKARDVGKLAEGLLANDPNAFVIGNKLNGRHRTLTFQSMKGLNGLQGRNLIIIPTMLSPEHYAELNVVGQWLGNPEEIIKMYYVDAICQAVGRNKGFRDNGASVQVISNRQLAESILLPEMNELSRVRLYRG